MTVACALCNAWSPAPAFARVADEPPSATQPAPIGKRTKLKNRKPDQPAPAAPASQAPTAPSAVRGPVEETSPAQAAGWTIVLGIFRGDDQVQAARETLSFVRSDGGVPEARIERRGPAMVIASGRFASSEDPDARAELARVREMVVAGGRPFAGAYLAPPYMTANEGAIPQYALARVREQYGADALYTLQIGVYARDDLDRPTERELAECRRTAEQAAAKLRQEGELAFYHHGPRRSMVTIGVFDITDFDPQAPSFKSARLREAQKRFPYNLYNGEAIREKLKSFTQPRLQPSNLVALPG